MTYRLLIRSLRSALTGHLTAFLMTALLSWLALYLENPSSAVLPIAFVSLGAGAVVCAVVSPVCEFRVFSVCRIFSVSGGTDSAVLSEAALQPENRSRTAASEKTNLSFIRFRPDPRLPHPGTYTHWVSESTSYRKRRRSRISSPSQVRDTDIPRPPPFCRRPRLYWTA